MPEIKIAVDVIMDTVWIILYTGVHGDLACGNM